MNKFIRYII